MLFNEIESLTRVCLVPRKGVKKSTVARFGFIW
jgi:hypothetical protein